MAFVAQGFMLKYKNYCLPFVIIDLSSKVNIKHTNFDYQLQATWQYKAGLLLNPKKEKRKKKKPQGEEECENSK